MSPETSPPTRADVLLRESLAMLAPLVRLLIAEGVAYPQFAQSLKRVFLDAASAELKDDGARATDSALSLLSGVHRKDVRFMSRGDSAETRPSPRRSFSVAAEVFGRWTNDPQWTDTAGRPRALPVRGRDGEAAGELSFEALAASISKDFHPRSILEELVRLGVAELVGDEVRVHSDTFVPQDSFSEMVFYLSRNVGDHLATAAANVRSMRDGGPSLLENSLSADGLSPASASALHELARAHWNATFRQMFAEAAKRHEADQSTHAPGPRQRIRFGAYFFVTPDDTANVAPQQRSDDRPTTSTDDPA